MNLTEGPGGFNAADLPDVMHLENPETGASKTHDVKREVNQFKRGSTGGSAPSTAETASSQPQERPKQEKQPQDGAPQNPDQPRQVPWGDITNPQNPLYPVQYLPSPMIWNGAHSLGTIFSNLISGGEASSHDIGESWQTKSPLERAAFAVPGQLLPPVAAAYSGVAGASNALHGKPAPSVDEYSHWFYKDFLPNGGLRGISDLTAVGFGLDTIGQSPKDSTQIPGYVGGLLQVPQLADDLKGGPKPADIGWDAKTAGHLISSASMAAWAVAEAKVPGARFASEFFGKSPAAAKLMKAVEDAHAIKPPSGLDPEEIHKLMEQDHLGMITHALGKVDGIQPKKLIEGAPAAAMPHLDPTAPYTPRPADPMAAAAHDEAVRSWFKDWQQQHGLLDKKFTPAQQQRVFDQSQARQAESAQHREAALAEAQHNSYLSDLQQHYAALGGQGRVTSQEELQKFIQNEGPKFGRDQLRYLMNSSAWHDARMPYDLYSGMKGEPSILDPRTAIEKLPANLQGEAQSTLASLNNWLVGVYSGPHGASNHPIKALARNLIGMNRETHWSTNEHVSNLSKFLQKAGLHDDASQANLIKALNGNEQARGALTPAEQFVESIHRLKMAALRKEGVGAGHRKADEVVPFYLPRVAATSAQLGKREQALVEKELQNIPGFRSAAGSSVAKGLGYKRGGHRVQALLPDENGQLRLTSKFQDHFELNQEIDRQRTGLQTWLKENRPSLSSKTVGHLLDAYLPKYETNLLGIYGKSLSRDLSALHGHMAVEAMLHTTREHPALGEIPLAFKDAVGTDAPLSASRTQEAVTAPGDYVKLGGGAYSDYKFHPDFASYLNKAISYKSDNRNWHGVKSWKTYSLDIESAAVRHIMYSPMVHGLNVMSRVGTLAFTSPHDFVAHVWGMHKLPEAAREQMYYQARREFYQHGGMPNRKDNPFGALNKTGMEVTGDHEFANAAGALDQSDLKPHMKGNPVSAIAGVGKQVGHGYQNMEHAFWKKVNDFGVMAYAIEKKRAERYLGEGSQSAKMYAADRANSWMGAVRPEAWPSATAHNLARGIFFAPNWWRTWIELMGSTHDKAAIGTNKAIQMMRTQNEVRFLTAALAWQKVSGNALNMIGSGKPQWQNSPESRDQIDVSGAIGNYINPAGKAMAASGVPGVEQLGSTLAQIKPTDPKTEGHMVMENPFGRQERDMEMALGLQNGQSTWTKEGFLHGLTDTAVNRLSPLANAYASLMNVDLHRTVADGNNLRHVDPSQPIGPSAPGALMGLLQTTPMSFQLGRELEKKLQSGEDPVGPWGTKLPKTVADSMGGVAQAGLGMLMTGLTGVTTPHMAASKTQGVQPSDQQYIQFREAKKKHDDTEAKLWQQVMTGQIQWDEWRTKHAADTQSYDATVKDTFKNSPSYRNGTIGLVHGYEALYDDRNNQDEFGQPDPAKIRAAQSEFKSKLTTEQQHGLEAELTKNDHSNPALHIYHDTINAYANFQGQVAREIGVTPEQFRAQMAEYGQAYNDPALRAQVTAKYPYIPAYEAAKRQWETTSWAGLMYGMLYDSSTVNRWFDANGGDQMRQRVTQEWNRAESG